MDGSSKRAAADNNERPARDESNDDNATPWQTGIRRRRQNSTSSNSEERRQPQSTQHCCQQVPTEELEQVNTDMETAGKMEAKTVEQIMEPMEVEMKSQRRIWAAGPASLLLLKIAKV